MQMVIVMGPKKAPSCPKDSMTPVQMDCTLAGKDSVNRMMMTV